MGQMNEWNPDILLKILEHGEQQIREGKYSPAAEVFERLEKRMAEHRREAVA